jgi:hemerythrin-like domain-containing protein
MAEQGRHSMNPSEQLRVEHGTTMKILRVLDALGEKVSTRGNDLKEDFQRILFFLEDYVDRCHHGKEENHLFPMLREEGGRREEKFIATLCSEHEAGRDLLRDLSAQMAFFNDQTGFSGVRIRECVKCYTDLFRRHIRKENADLLPLMETLSKEKKDRLSEQFSFLSFEIMGRKGQKWLESRLEQLSNKHRS